LGETKKRVLKKITNRPGKKVKMERGKRSTSRKCTSRG